MLAFYLVLAAFLVVVIATGIVETLWPDAEPPRWLKRIMGQ